jgi:hypothetical protein
MSEIFTFTAEELMPDRVTVLEHQGIPAGTEVKEEIAVLCTTALGLLVEVAAPMGILAEINKRDFVVIYHGAGQNEPHTPVGDILGDADNQALFAVTLGRRISQEIEKRFQADDCALGCMLDAAASAAADQLADMVQRRFRRVLAESGRLTPDTGVLHYSPGYCGWHISGQKKLFEFLRPERIGITLRDSFLMEPLKSVSGVVLAGPREMHDFPTAYPFCRRCETRGCRARVRALMAE